MTEAERKALVEESSKNPVYMPNGVRASLVGWKTPECGVSGPTPGFWHCSWEKAAEVAARPNRRFLAGEVYKVGEGWLGLPLTADDFQTPEDYERWKETQGQ